MWYTGRGINNHWYTKPMVYTITGVQNLSFIQAMVHSTCGINNHWYTKPVVYTTIQNLLCIYNHCYKDHVVNTTNGIQNCCMYNQWYTEPVVYTTTGL